MNKYQATKTWFKRLSEEGRILSALGCHGLTVILIAVGKRLDDENIRIMVITCNAWCIQCFWKHNHCAIGQPEDVNDVRTTINHPICELHVISWERTLILIDLFLIFIQFIHFDNTWQISYNFDWKRHAR